MATPLLKIAASVLVAAAGVFLYDPARLPPLTSYMPDVMVEMQTERAIVGVLVVFAAVVSMFDALVAIARRSAPEPVRLYIDDREKGGAVARF